MKAVDVKSNTYINYDIYYKRLCFILVGTSFVIKKVSNTVSWTYVIRDLKGEEIVGMF